MLDEQLQTRFALLRSSGLADADIVEFMGSALADLERAVGRPATDTEFGGLVTHTTLALQRVRKGEAVTEWEVDHSEELAAFPGALRASEAFAARAAADLGLDLPAQERQFMALHLAAVEQGTS
jgi:hypothetical protein